jgi:hypothetical protein
MKAQAAPSAHPFALSLSKGFSSRPAGEGQGKGFDRLSPNGSRASTGE